MKRSVWVTISQIDWLLLNNSLHSSYVRNVTPLVGCHHHQSSWFVTKIAYSLCRHQPPLSIFASLFLLLSTRTHAATLSPRSRGSRTKGISTFLLGLLLDLQPSDKLITRSAESPCRQRKLQSWSMRSGQAPFRTNINWWLNGRWYITL